MKFRAQLPDQYVVVDAESEAEAQDMAFALLVRRLRPQEIAVWATGEDDAWDEEGQETAA